MCTIGWKTIKDIFLKTSASCLEWCMHNLSPLMSFVVVLQEYVRGLCDPELQKEERYPVDMHCIFAGARGLFLDRLIRDTSAEVLVPEPGRLRLLGRTEPVVMAQSRVQQFVALFQVKLIYNHWLCIPNGFF